ncbi:hypothetical protein LMG27174_00132 [Paraburkholderia rhynchosiae]|uniref:Uncharacterized protein n=1 Tax=Paraburkholderia rhynchosiae TaxID=487049 RepID=A0A6J4ZMN1_9BURK|nr:hypothetical protein LMG27174_00132 [Paraburkholderia rhynchosiae]
MVDEFCRSGAQCRRSSLFDHIGNAALSLNAPAAHGAGPGAPAFDAPCCVWVPATRANHASHAERTVSAGFFDHTRRMR